MHRFHKGSKLHVGTAVEHWTWWLSSKRWLFSLLFKTLQEESIIYHDHIRHDFVLQTYARATFLDP